MSNNMRKITMLLLVMLGLCATAVENTELVTKCQSSVLQVIMTDANDVPVGKGSGFIVGPGLVATCCHVIKQGEAAWVKSSDKISYPVEGITAYNKDQDLAILSVPKLTGTALPLGDSAGVQAGEHVVVLGSPLGLEGTAVTDGVVSALRTFSNYDKVLQISCPVSPGNSGGPLLNSQGQVIGVVAFSMIDGQNVNFGIAINQLKALLVNQGKQLTLKEMREAAGDQNPGDLGLLPARKAYLDAKVPKNAPYSLAPFIGLNILPESIEVAVLGKQGSVTVLKRADNGNQLAADTFSLSAAGVLMVAPALKAKILRMTFSYQPRQIAIYVDPASAKELDPNLLSGIIAEKLKGLGYESIRGAEVDSAYQTCQRDGGLDAEGLARKLNVSGLVFVGCAAKNDSDLINRFFSATLTLAMYDFTTESVLVKGRAQYHKTVKSFAMGTEELQKLVLSKSIDAIFSNTQFGSRSITSVPNQ